MLETAWIILKTELRLHLQQPGHCLYPLAFFAIIVSFFMMGLSPEVGLLEKYLPIYLWIGALLAGFLSISHVFHADIAEGHLEQLLLSPTALPLNLLAKLIAEWLVTALPLIILSYGLCWGFEIQPRTTLMLLLGLLLGTSLFTLLGGLVAALTLGLHQPGTFLGLLLLPLALPILLLGITLIQAAQAGLSVNGLVAFLIALNLLAITFLPLSIAGALKMSVEG
jgi:heme exporter protein B